MDDSAMINLYKQTSINLEPQSASSIITIQAPHPARGNWLPSPKRKSTNSHEAFVDEKSFAEHCLSSEGSVFFRDPKRSPRSFLWRVLDGHKVFEIRCADLTRSRGEREPTREGHLTLRLEFAEAILPKCVALADHPQDDHPQHDILYVFAFTTSRILFTFALRPEFFRRPDAVGNVSDWCTTFEPPLLGSPCPHRLHAGTAFELYFSLDDGSLVRLRRSSDGSRWEPTTYSDGAWTNSIRGLVKWQGQQSVRYDGRSIDASTPIAIGAAPDLTYVYTVSVNHSLKAWNLSNRKLNVTKDLLNRPRQQNDNHPLQLNPAESCFVRVFNAERAREGDRHYLVTFSPHDNGQFKFWAVKGGLTGPLVLEDLYPEDKFQPPDPDPMGNTIWNLADFDLKTSEDGNAMELYVLWKNNTATQLNVLLFDLFQLPRTWEGNWVGVIGETSQEPDAKSDLDPVDATEAWMKYLFHPGRFSAGVLETSLSIFQDAMRANSKSTHQGDKSLPERICSTVASTVSLWRRTDSGMDHERYRNDTDAQWRQFWRIVEDVNKLRKESLSLVYDRFSDMAWTIQTGGCCSVRECTTTELLLANEGKNASQLAPSVHGRLPHRTSLRRDSGRTSSLMRIAATFRKHFPAELAHACMVALDVEIFQEPILDPSARLMAFYEGANFADFIDDGAFDNLSDNMGEIGGFSKLDIAWFQSIVETFPGPYQGGESKLASTLFGLRTVTSVAEETVFLNWQVLFDLLIFVIFVEIEVHQAGEKMDKFDGSTVFIALIDQLKEYEVLKWLAVHSRESPYGPSDSRIPGRIQANSDGQMPIAKVSTLLEDWARDVTPLSLRREPQSYVLTHTAGEVLSCITRSGEVTYEEAVVYIQCDLIRNAELGLASEFLRFQPSNAWSTYVKGRLYLAKNDFTLAALHFQKAAYLLSHGRSLGNLTEMSSQLLDPVEADCFNNGLPKYYMHIFTLFERAKAYSHVTDFARLALDALSLPFSKRADKMSDANLDDTALRSEILSRLFESALLTSSYDNAYMALSLYTDSALRKSALSTLITSMAASPAGTSKLMSLPFASHPRMASMVDSVLLAHASNATPLSILPLKHSTLKPSPPYHQILYSLRLSRNDYRGAAAVLFTRLQLLRKSPAAINDPEANAIRHELLALINVLSCVPEDEAYILAEVETYPRRPPWDDPPPGPPQKKDMVMKRRIVTLENLRKEYQDVLDRVSDIESGKFEFGAYEGDGEGEQGDEDGMEV